MKIKPNIIFKTWGYEKIFYNELYCAKTLTLHPDEKTSMHFHPKKHETITVVSGIANVNIQGKDNVLIENESVIIEPGTKHYIHNLSGSHNLLIAEASTKDSTDDSIRV